MDVFLFCFVLFCFFFKLFHWQSVKFIATLCGRKKDNFASRDPNSSHRESAVCHTGQSSSSALVTGFHKKKKKRALMGAIPWKCSSLASLKGVDLF